MGAVRRVFAGAERREWERHIVEKLVFVVFLSDVLFCSMAGGIDRLFYFVYCLSSEGEHS
jgi:hypothetical protein